MRWGAAFLMLSACSPGRAVVSLPAAASSILAVTQGDHTDVFAIEGDGTGAEQIPIFDAFVGDPAIDLSVDLYDESMATLGIHPGLLRPDSTGGRAPLPARSAHRTLDQRGDGEWKIFDGPKEPRLDAFRSSDLPHNTCTGFEARSVQLEGSTDHVIALLADGDDILAITSTPLFADPGPNDLWRVSFTVPPTVEHLHPPGFDAISALGRVITATRSQDGRIWLSLATRRSFTEIWVGTIEGGFAPIAVPKPDRPVEWVWWMAIQERPLRLWTLGDAGSLNRYDDATSTWTTVQRSNTESIFCSSPLMRCGGLAIDGDGTVVFVDTRDQTRAFSVDPTGRVVPETLPDLADGTLNAVSSTPIGPAILRSSALDTSVYVRRNGAWKAAASPEGQTAFHTQRAYAIGAWREGWIASGVYGFVLQHNGKILCPLVDAVVPDQAVAVFAATPLGFAMADGFDSATPMFPPEIAMVRPMDQ